MIAKCLTSKQLSDEPSKSIEMFISDKNDFLNDNLETENIN